MFAVDAVLSVKLPLKFGLQPEGAAAEGAMPSLTACAAAVAARQRVERMMENFILVAGGNLCNISNTCVQICTEIQRASMLQQLNVATKEEHDKQSCLYNCAAMNERR
jgi:cytosine/adenosine deaminase-related metal-dependent hydrolase